MQTEKQFICINCPMGCRLTVQVEEGRAVSVEGNECKRGEEFARQEAVEPMRILTSLMRVKGREKPFSVKTSAPVPRKLLTDCAAWIFAHPAAPEALPIHIGDVIIENICKSGVDIISTQEVQAGK